MNISKRYISEHAQAFLEADEKARQAMTEVESSLSSNHTTDDKFVLCSKAKGCNGTESIKTKTNELLDYEYGWTMEKALSYLKDRTGRGGPIDAFKSFDGDEPLKVGFEFETGNIASAHRSANKLKIGFMNGEVDLAVLALPSEGMTQYLTGRTASYEELEPYFPLFGDIPFICLGFEADEYNPDASPLPKKAYNYSANVSDANGTE